MSEFAFDKGHIKPIQFFYLPNTICLVSENLCKDLVRSITEQELHYSHVMMGVFFQAVVNPTATTVTSVVEKEVGQKVVKSGSFLVFHGRVPSP